MPPSFEQLNKQKALQIYDPEPIALGELRGLAFDEAAQPVLGEGWLESLAEESPRLAGQSAPGGLQRASWFRVSLLISLVIHGLVATVFYVGAREVRFETVSTSPLPLQIGLRARNPQRSPDADLSLDKTPAKPLDRTAAMPLNEIATQPSPNELDTLVEQQEESTATRRSLSDGELEFETTSQPPQDAPLSSQRTVLSVSDSPPASARLAPSAEAIRKALGQSQGSDIRNWRRPCTESQRRAELLECEQESSSDARFAALEANATYSALQLVRSRSRSERSLPAVAANASQLRQTLGGRGADGAVESQLRLGVYLLEELEAAITLGSSAENRNQQHMRRVTDTTAVGTMVERIVNDPWIKNAELVRRSRRVVD